MTVSTTTTKNSYSGNGTLHSFAYGFKIFADADLSVVVRNAAGAETTKTLNTHYIVTNAGTDTGGNVLFKFNTGTSSDAHHSTSDFRPASGETVVISRALTLTQGTDYVANDPFPANSHENALDRLTMIQQQQQEELDRTIKASVTNTISGAEFTTSASDRANKVMSFDGSGNLTVTTGKVDTVSVSISGLTTGASATASATFTASSGALALALGIPAGATGATGPAGGGLAQLVADTSPELGGDLDVLAKDIVSSSNRTIDLAPHGTGTVVVRGNTNSGAIVFNCESNSHGQKIIAQPHSASVTNTMLLPAGASSTLVSLVSTDTLTNKTLTSPKINEDVAVTSTATELNYLDITTLGLSQASKAVTADANGVITLDNGFSEEYAAVTSSSNAIAINLRTANNFSHTLTENTTISFANPAASGKVSAFTLKVIQASSAKSITWHSSIKWAGDEAPTLSTGNGNVDVFCGYTVDGGTNYYMFTAGQVMS